MDLVLSSVEADKKPMFSFHAVLLLEVMVSVLLMLLWVFGGRSCAGAGVSIYTVA